jgi:hypothetical protein
MNVIVNHWEVLYTQPHDLAIDFVQLRRLFLL